jgi:hypothetical protein
VVDSIRADCGTAAEAPYTQGGGCVTGKRKTRTEGLEYTVQRLNELNTLCVSKVGQDVLDTSYPATLYPDLRIRIQAVSPWRYLPFRALQQEEGGGS